MTKLRALHTSLTIVELLISIHYRVPIFNPQTISTLHDIKDDIQQMLGGKGGK